MSYTTILAITPGSKVETLKKLSNSCGTTSFVWNEMSQVFLGVENDAWIEDRILKKLWSSYKNKRIPKYQRAVLMMTFHLAYVAKRNFNRAVLDIYNFLTEFPPKIETVTHWKEIAEVFQSSPDCEAIGLYHAYLSNNPFLGSWNEETEKYDSIDWKRTFEIYEELDGLSNEEEKSMHAVDIPIYLLRILRQREGLNISDKSMDIEFCKRNPRTNFTNIIGWELGDTHWAEQIFTWLEELGIKVDIKY